METLPKAQIIVAAVAAIILAVITSSARSGAFSPLVESLEALSFLLSAAAVYSSARALRSRYETLGLNKNVARRSLDYMRARRSLRCYSYIAALTIASLVAPHFNISRLFAVAALAVALPPVILIADQLTGWRGSSMQ